MDSQVAFTPPVSSSAPVNYSIALTVLGTLRTITGSVTALGGVSAECRPVGSTVGGTKNRGVLVAQFSYPSGALINVLTDNNNCGTCGTVCASQQKCVNGACLGTGEIEVALTWERSGDLDL